jgi:hypothetical protein
MEEKEEKVVFSSEDEEENPLNFDIYDKEEVEAVTMRNSKRDLNHYKRPKTTPEQKLAKKNMSLFQSDYIKEKSKKIENPVFEHFTTYKFVKIEDLEATKKEFKEATKEICGTVLIGKEGVNLFVSGLQEDISNFEKFLLSDKRFEGCYIKRGTSKQPAYRKMVVKIKQEIVTMVRKKTFNTTPRE